MCGNGYILNGNICICGVGNNISESTGKCVTCNIQNCYKCSNNDICDLFFNNNANNNLLNSANLISDIQNLKQ